MRILLDTSYLYGLMSAPGKLSDAERQFLANPSVHMHVSAVSIWEMRLKNAARYRSGVRKSSFDPNAVLAVLEGQDVTFIPMTMQHAARKLDVPLSHHDPFDEMLLVQAQEEGLKLLTGDGMLVGHPLAMTVSGSEDPIQVEHM